MLPDRVSNPGPLTYESGPYRLRHVARLFKRRIGQFLLSVSFVHDLFPAFVFELSKIKGYKLVHQYSLRAETVRHKDYSSSIASFQGSCPQKLAFFRDRRHDRDPADCPGRKQNYADRRGRIVVVVVLLLLLRCCCFACTVNIYCHVGTVS